jgi:hypothetical protein
MKFCCSEPTFGANFYPPELNKANPDIWNNNIEAFPFPSVFDFISDIDFCIDPVISVIGFGDSMLLSGFFAATLLNLNCKV